MENLLSDQVFLLSSWNYMCNDAFKLSMSNLTDEEITINVKFHYTCCIYT